MRKHRRRRLQRLAPVRAASRSVRADDPECDSGERRGVSPTCISAHVGLTPRPSPSLFFWHVFPPRVADTVVDYRLLIIPPTRPALDFLPGADIMRRRGYLAMGLALALLGIPQATLLANVPTALTPAQVEQARGWVRQLGDRSFKTREQATKK